MMQTDRHLIRPLVGLCAYALPEGLILRIWPRCKMQVQPCTALQPSLIVWMSLFRTHGPLGVGGNSLPYACVLMGQVCLFLGIYMLFKNFVGIRCVRNSVLTFKTDQPQPPRFFNLELAIKCSFAMWSLLAIALVGMFGVAGLGGNVCVFPCLVCLPVATFFVVFFFGQDLTGARWSMSLWVDKLCIHQTDLELKAKQIAALPVFVAHASRMLILWDETYFERLWCNLELATFVHNGGIQNVDLLPLWLAPWLLCSILLDLLSAGLFELLEHVLPNWSMRWVPPIMEATESLLGKNPAMLKFVTCCVIWMFSGITYLLVSVPSFFLFA